VRALVLIALISLSLGLPPGAALIPARAQAQGGDRGAYSIVVDVNFVVFNVTVTDNKGRQVAGLKASDFQIREANRAQDIKVFGAENAPATVGIVIDNSGSMRNKRANVVDAALAFAGASHPEDELFLLNFNEKVTFGLPPSLPFTSNFAQLRSALLDTRADGLTALYDALATGIEHLKAGTRDRKVLVVLSDGGDNASRRSLDDVLGIAQRSNATIYTIGIYDEDNPDRNPRALRRIADLSGGRAFFPQSLEAMEQAWGEIAEAIRSQYTIGYLSTNSSRDGAFRKVQITAGRNGRRDLRVAARDGYFAPTDERIGR
jgi:Ca-activated chloride channel family protein